MFKLDVFTPRTELNYAEPCSAHCESYSAREKYSSAAVAGYYNERRFQNSRGKRLAKLEHAAVARSLRFIGAPGSVLDLPCGTGRLHFLLRDAGFEVHGADYSEEMMRRIPADAPYQSLTKADARNLPFAAQTFTGAVCIRLMHHLPRAERIAVLRELNRVTKHFVVVSFHSPVSFKSFLRRLKAPWTNQNRTPNNRSTPQNFTQEAAEAGLTLVANFPAAAFFSERWVAVLRKPEA